MSDAEDLDFLRQQIEYLTNVLHEYQAKYPPLATPHGDAKATGVVPPWIVDPKLVNPLLLEYESTVGALTKELENYKHNYKTLQKQTDQLIVENETLADDLQKTLEDKIAPIKDIPMPGGDDLTAIENLQTQLRLLDQEKVTCNELLRASQREVSRLEEELHELRATKISSQHWDYLNQQHEDMKVRYTQTITELNQELTLARDDCGKHKRDAELAEKRLQDFKKSILQAKNNINLQDKSHVIKAEEKARLLEIELEAKIAENSDMQSDLDNLHELVEQHLEQIRNLAKLCGQKEAEIQTARDRVKDAVDTAEEAVLQKNEMSLSLKNYQAECDRLREELTILCDKAGKKTKDEVDKVQAYNDLKINKLNDTVHSIEMENGALKAEIERMVREKRSVESELEKVYKDGVQKAYQDGGRYDQLSQRACNAEKERDEVKIKLCTTEAELKRMEMRMANDKLKMEREIDQLTERVSSLQKDFDLANADRLRHLETANTAEELANSVKREAEAAERKHNKEMLCMEHSTSLRETEFETKLRTIEETHRKAMNKLRDDIFNQQRSANQWKDEYHLLSDKWEKTVQTLRSECSEKDSRISQLTQLLKEANDKTLEAESMMRDYSNQMRKIELRTKEAERRATEAMTQVATKDAKIKHLIMHHRQLLAAKNLTDPTEDTFRISEMREAGDVTLSQTRTPSVLSELSFNRGELNSGIHGGSRDFKRSSEFFQ